MQRVSGRRCERRGVVTALAVPAVLHRRAPLLAPHRSQLCSRYYSLRLRLLRGATVVLLDVRDRSARCTCAGEDGMARCHVTAWRS